MAVLADPRFRAVDDTGNVYVSAVLTVYTAGTTTPANIFRDAALTQAMTNPTSGADKSNSHGYFPQVFAAETATFDIICTSATGTTLWSLVNVPATGSDSGDITRDFGTGGRLTITGAAGVIEYQAGPPTGDNTGGTALIGGYAGTQADLITLDGASVNTTGTLTENSKKLPGVVSTSGTFTTVASVDIALANSPTGVRAWAIEFTELVFSAASGMTITLRFSYDNGATYKADTSYRWGNLSNASYTQDAGAVTGGVITASTTGTSAAGYKPTIEMNVWGPNSADGSYTRANGTIWTEGNSFQRFSITYAADAGRPTNMRMLFSTGTGSGRYRVMPRRGLGD